MGDWSVGFAIEGMDIGDTGRIGAAPWPVVRAHKPRADRSGALSAGIEHLGSSSRRLTAFAVA
ncbi:hypothetical protein CQ10_40525 [Bradyrhizobium valentinum]|nr:hypothetical protein CQ10_40525 [Bradyrhizobium valentinum]